MRTAALLGALAALLVVAFGHARDAAPASPRAQIAVATAGGRIVLIDPSGRRLATLTRPKRAGWADWAPAWSPDGKRLAFVRTTDARRSFHVYVMHADGSGVRRLTKGPFEYSPSWSPDGRWIAYTASDGIRVMRLDGSGSRRVLGTGLLKPGCSMSYASEPSWTPGGRLAYSFHAEIPRDWPASCDRASSHCGWVLTVRRDGNHRRPVVRGRDAHWSPNAGSSSIRRRTAALRRFPTGRGALDS